MAAQGYTVNFQDVALVANTAKSVASIKAASNKVATLRAFVFTCDGTSAANTPVLVELCSGDATSAGTATAVTPNQVRGRVGASAATGAKNYSAEPTTLTQFAALRYSPTAGVVFQFPLGGEYECDTTTTKLIVARFTAVNAVNVTGWLEFEE